MKASAKIALVGAGILVAGVGIGVFGGFIAMTNKEGADNIIIRDKENTITASDSISTLTLGTTEDHIEVYWSDMATEIEIKYFDADEEDKEIYVVKRTSTTLELKINDDFWKKFINIQWPWNERDDTKRPMKVTIPKSMENLVVITSTVSGDITLNKDGAETASVGSSVINTVSGNIYAKSIDSKKQITVNTVSGSINLDSVKSVDSHIEVNGTSGAFQIKNSSAKDKVKVNSVSGAIVIDTLKCESLEAASVSAAIDVSKLDVERKVDISTVSGKVKLNVIDSKDNYSIKVDTVSGSRNIENVKDTTRAKEIVIATTSGSINVSFGEIL